MHQELIMNEQNSGKNFEGNWMEIGGNQTYSLIKWIGLLRFSGKNILT